MKSYIHEKYDYVYVVEIPIKEIAKLDFESCKEPKETLSSWYNRQTEKPKVLINGGFFNMSSGEPCFHQIDDGDVRASSGKWVYGIGTTEDSKGQPKFGAINDGTAWWDFVSGYPTLLADSDPITAWGYASEINYNAARSILGFNDDTLFVVAISKPGMAFTAMSRLMYHLGCKYAINLDGGGSSRLMVDGEVFNKPTENRSVDSVIAIYMKETPNETTVELPAENTDTEYYIEYIVKRGDSWWKIAANEMGSGSLYKDLAAFNGKSVDVMLRPGDVLKIPVDYYIYTVQVGDSWWKISATQLGSGVRYRELMEYNGLTSSHVLHPGDEIKIPV